MNTSLDVAEAQAGALCLDRGEVDLSDVIRQLANLYQPAIAERQHELKLNIEDGIVVDADAHLLHRVVSNLLENELAHLQPGREIGIRLTPVDSSAELVIEDNGTGFPPEICDRAFERFVKGKHWRGHGLGLAFVNAVVQAHGGTVKISNRREGGALITVSLPAKVLYPTHRPV